MAANEEIDEPLGVELVIPEWVYVHKGGEEDAYEAMREWLFDDPWSKNKVRVPTQAIQIRNVKGDGYPVLWKHNTKTDGDEIEASFRAFCDGMLVETDDPMRYTWLISRGFNPELANFDSPRTFNLMNRAALDAPAEDRRGISQMEGVHLNRPTVTMPAQGITGDIGGTGIRELGTEIRAMNRGHVQDITALLDYTIKTVTQCLDYTKKMISQHPEALDRQAERDHELARMRLEAQREPGYVQVAGKIAAPAVNGVMALSKTNPELAAKFADVIAAFAPGAGGDE